MAEQWDIDPGAITTRQTLDAKYGGGLYGGIVPSRTTKNILLFSDPREGEKYGYTFDGPATDGVSFYYTGAGSSGDHQLTNRNRAIADHAAEGRALRLFVADGYSAGSRTKLQKYVGEFALDSESTSRREVAPGRDGRLRTVIVFHLHPVGPTLDARGEVQANVVDPTVMATVRETPREFDTVFSFEHAAQKSSAALKREALLVARYESWRGVILTRWSIRVPESNELLLTDVYDSSTRTLFEAKASADRGSMRTAVGQLLDYRRHIPIEHLNAAVLLPERPDRDLANYLDVCEVGAVWERVDGGFSGSALHRSRIRNLLL